MKVDLTPWTYDQIDLVVTEDGQAVMAYAYPNAHDDDGVVVVIIGGKEMVREMDARQ